MTTSQLIPPTQRTPSLARAEPLHGSLTPRTPAFTQRVGELTATQVHAARWRVTSAGGVVRGYVEAHGDETSPRFAARRMSRTTTTFLTLEEFHDFFEAVRAFRYL